MSRLFPGAVRQLQLLAQRSRQRRLLLLAGTRDWCMQSALVALDSLDLQHTHWFSDKAPPGAASSQGSAALRLLGTELDALVFDAWSGFDPDAFGALTGTLRAGGLLLLLTPPLSEWSAFPDPQNARIAVEPYSPESLSTRFIQRLIRILATDPDVLRVEQDKPIAFHDPEPETRTERLETVAAPCRTSDQQRAVEAVRHVATGHRRRPVVLIADRGRGKSAAFGIAAAQLIQMGRDRILVTGPGLESVQAVLDHAWALLPERQHAAIRFMAPDVLVQNPRRADLLLVDEAAALPTPILSSLLQHYAHIAFATTVHGYEGTGQGFALRFSRMLDLNSNSWKSIQMTTPIRWASGDPLERLSFRMLLLDANAVAEEQIADLGCDRFTIERIDRDLLLEDESSLDELFGLLVQAHYRTRPLDLRHLLDGPNLAIYVLRIGAHIAATVLLAEEGELDACRSEAICAGISRPRGHLLPQTLAAHQGLCEALRLKGARVIRIAVHPAVRRRRLGTQLLQHVAMEARKAGCNYLGSSFGATPELLRFWGRSGAVPVRVGFQRGATSGCHSVVVLCPLSPAGDSLYGRARERFFGNLPHQLADSLRDLEAELVVELLRDAGPYLLHPGEADWQDARCFAFGRRLPETSIGALWRVACFALMDTAAVSRLEREEVVLLVARILQMHSWQYCVELIGVKGRAAALVILRSAVGRLIGYYCPDE